METTRDQYTVPTQLGRIVYWSLLGCFVALYFTVEPAIENLSPSLNEDASLAELRAAANWQDQLFVYICLLSVFIFGVLAMLFFRWGYQSYSTQKFPPDGAIVLVKTRIRAGAYARRMAIFYYVMAIIFVIYILALIYLAWNA